MPSLVQPADGARDYRDLVATVVASIPPGRVLSYGDVAELIESGGPRQAARALALGGRDWPWWRVVRADGSLPGRLQASARAEHLSEGTPLRGDRVDMSRARWNPVAAELSALRRRLSVGDDLMEP